MRDYIDCGSAPCSEDCAQVGNSDYGLRAKKECRLYLEQLRRHFGEEPEGAQLAVKCFP
jgi:hypothetical protein